MDNGTPETLSSGQVLTGRRLVRRFATLNGITVALLMDSMLMLYAIQNGAGDAALAVLAASIHLTMPLMLVGKALISRYGAARTWGFGWMCRNTSAMVMLLAPFLPETTPQAARTALILLGGFGFAGFRAIGLVGNSPLIGEITSETDRGSFLSGNWTRATVTQLITLTAVIGLFQYADALWMYQLVIGFGALVGVYVGWLLLRVPETETPRHSAGKPLGEMLKRVWIVPGMRKLLFAWAGCFAAFTLVIPFAVITLKNGYGLNDYQALAFSLITLLGGFSSAAVNERVADTVGPRPLLIVYVSGLALIAVAWALAPDDLSPAMVTIAFFLAGFCKYGIIIAGGHYLLNTAERSDRVGSSMVLRAASGAIAGLIGSVVGAGVLGALNSVGLDGMEVYRWYFRVAAGLFCLIVPLVVRLDKLEEWPVGETLLLLVRPWKIIGSSYKRGSQR